MILKTILIFLVTVLGYSEWALGTSYFQRPIVLGPLVGLIMGDLQAGIVMGATLELAMIGAVSIGAYNPPDLIAGTILGVSLAIQSGANASAALTLGIPIATLLLAANTAIGEPLRLIFIHRCDKNAEDGNYKAFSRNMWISGYIASIFGIIFVPLAFYFGSDAVTKVLEVVPEFVQTGMDIAAGLLPALGFAMLAQMMMNKKVAPFFFIGFLIVAYSSITTTGVAVLSFLMVVIFVTYGMLNDKKEQTVEVVSKNDDGGGFDEF